MLDTLTFLLEKLIILAHVKLSVLLLPAPHATRRELEDASSQLAGAPHRFERGDLLEVPRTLFTHFGIYLGENRVAHLIPDILPLLTADGRRIQEMVTNTRLLLGVLTKRATIRIDSVEDFAYGAGILLNTMDRTVVPSPLAGEEVARRAERLVGTVSYSLLWNNCEHFVTFCRYGTAQSLQTEQTFADYSPPPAVDSPPPLEYNKRNLVGLVFSSCIMISLQLLTLIFISMPRRQEKKEDVKKRRRHGEEKLRRGDLLVVPRTLFTHFGIYLGADRVAHFIPDILPMISSDTGRIAQMVTNTRLLLGVLAKHGSVRVDTVDDFAYGSKILVNTPDKVCSQPALHGEEVARRAEKLLGHISYSLLWYNCEHFVMYCRYGTVVSFQTFQFCKTVRKLLLSRVLAKMAAMLGACLLYAGALTTSSAVPVVFLPFLIWMTS